MILLVILRIAICSEFDIIVALLITKDHVSHLFGVGQVQPGNKIKVNAINVVFLMIDLAI